MELFSNDVVLGTNGTGHAVVLPKERRCRHVVSIGATGVGKSKALESIIRQDMRAWPETRCGITLFDPHGAVVDNLIAFAASAGLDHLPVIPFDCRRLDWILSFNPLRARGGIEPATIISSCIDSLLHAWGQWETNETPRLEKWLRTILLTVFLSGGTLGDSLAILRSPELRRSVARRIEDDVVRTVWQSSASLKEAEFQTITESLCNRVVRFVSATMLRLTLNQTGASLDFGQVMKKGGIVLISLATEGGAIDDADARTLGSLLLSDLWTAAKMRGKGEAGRKRSFRVFIDEFQKYLTPTMAEGLAEARGFALEFYLSCQSATQLRATAAGRQVLDAVLANAHTKIIFNVQHPDDLDTLTPWLFRHEINPDLIKHQHYATKVLDHHIKYFDSVSQTATRGTSNGQNWGTTESVDQSTGSSVGHTDTTGTSHTFEHSRSIGHSDSASLETSHSHGNSVARSSQEGLTESSGDGYSDGRTISESENHHLDGDYDSMINVVGDDSGALFDEAFVDDNGKHRSLHRAIDRTVSESETEGESHSESLARTRSTSSAYASQDTESESTSVSSSTSESFSEGESESTSFQRSDSQTTSQSTTTGSANTSGGSHTDSQSKSNGVTSAPMLMPILGKEALPPQFRSVEEQLFIFSQFLSSQPDRHAVVRIGNGKPIPVIVPMVPPAKISVKGARAWATLRLKRLEFAFPHAEALRRLEARRKEFEAKYLGTHDTGEPVRLVRRIKE